MFLSWIKTKGIMGVYLDKGSGVFVYLVLYARIVKRNYVIMY